MSQSWVIATSYDAGHHFKTILTNCSKKILVFFLVVKTPAGQPSLSVLPVILSVLSVFVLLVIPASDAVVSIDTGFVCHLRTNMKECFVVSQTQSSYCVELWILSPFAALADSPSVNHLLYPVSPLAGLCWPHINVFHFLWMLHVVIVP